MNLQQTLMAFKQLDHLIKAFEKQTYMSSYEEELYHHAKNIHTLLTSALVPGEEKPTAELDLLGKLGEIHGKNKR
jgi:hypothetical protein